MLLTNKIAIITGAARGIGKAIAFLFAKEGTDVVIADIDYDADIYYETTRKTARETAAEIEVATMRKALPIKVDISNKAEVEEMVKKVMDKFGRIDILVNNAVVKKEIPLFEIDE